jgi:hypothetical protein
LREDRQGTFRRVSVGKWRHIRYPGWVRFYGGYGNILDVEVRSRVKNAEWQVLQAFVGFIDRHFSERIRAVNIQYGND